MGRLKTLRHIAYVLALLCIVGSIDLYSQSIFTSNLSGGSGDWNSAASWTENNQGNPDDSDGIPDSDDDVVITGGDIINVEPAGTTTITDLTISGATLNYASNRTLTVTGNMTVTGTSAITGNNANRILNVNGNLDVNTSATLTINGQTITITGTTTLDGSLVFVTTTGTKTFGTIDVNASGTWDNSGTAEDFVFTGNVINDGTWNGCSGNGCEYEFTAANPTISGSSTITFADLTVNTSGSLTNNGTILLTDDLNGTGSLVNGATGDFQFQGTGPYNITPDFTTVGNTVTYTNTGNTPIINTTYYDFVVSKTGGRAQISTGLTVNNDVTITLGELRIVTGGTPTFSNDLIISGGQFTANAGTTTVSGNVEVQGGEFSPNNASATVNVTGDVNLSTGTIDFNDGDLNVTGDLAVTGGTMTMNGGTFDVDDVTVSTGSVTLTQGDLNINNVSGGLTVNSGSITMTNAAFTLDIDGTYTVAGGTNDLNNGTINTANWTVNNSATVLVGGVSPTVTGTTTVNGTFTVDANGGTKILNDINVSSTGNWNVTAAEGFTINGDITVDGTWTNCSNTTGCVYVLTDPTGVLSGTSSLSFSDLSIDNPGNYTSNTDVTITDELIGSGTFINGNGSTLTLEGAGPFSIDDLDATTVTNAVIYGGGSNVTVNGATYHNLTINKTGNTATISDAVTVNNDMSVQSTTVASATLDVTNDLNVSADLDIDATTTVSNDVTITGGILEVNAATLGVTNNLNIQDGEFTPNNTASIVNVGGNISMSDGLYDQNDGDVNITGDLLITGGSLTLNQTTTSAIDASDVSIATGSATLTSGQLNVTNATGGLTMTSGTLTLAGVTLAITNLYRVNGGTNQLNGGTVSADDLTIADGATVNLGDASMTISDATTLNGTLTTDDNGGTYEFNDITVAATGNWNTTAQASFTVNGDITVNGIWTGCSNTTGCVYTLTNSIGVISGTTSLDFSDLSITNPASYTSNTDVTITDELIGTGTFVNGNGSTLTLEGAGPFSIENLDATTVSNTVVYGGGSNVTVNGATYHNLTISKSGNLATISSAVTVNNDMTVSSNTDVNATTNIINDLTLTAGILEVNAATLDVTNNLSIQNGEFTPVNVASIVNVGGILSMSDGLFDHNDGDVSITGDFQITGGTMTMNQGAATSTFTMDDFTLATGTVTLSEGEFNITSGSGGMTVSSGSLTLAGTALVVTDDITINGGTNDYNGGSLTGLDFSIASGQTVNLGDITFDASGNTVLDGTLTTDDNGGTKSFGNITVNATGGWNVTAAESFDISGDITNNGTWTGCPTNGCDYTLTSGSGSLTGANTIAFSDLIINDPANYTSSTTVTVSDRFTGTGTFTNTAGNALTLSGATNDISFFTTSATGTTVTYNRTGGDQTLNATTDGQYYNLVISTDAAGSDVNMGSTETITNQLTLTTGDIFLGSNNLIIEDGATISGGNADSYIGLDGSGVLRQNFSAAGTTLTFPMGDNNDYSPISSFRITSGTFGAGAYVDFDVTDGNLTTRNTSNTPNGDDDGTNAVDYITRYWDLSANNINNVSYDATYSYVDADVVGTTEGNMIGAVYRFSDEFGVLDWKPFGSVNPLTNTVTVTDVDGFGTLFAMDNTANRLPIKLLSFAASVLGGRVVIDWATVEEINNDFFTIQRSTDAENWNDILTVNGAGNSEGVLNYRVEDAFPLEGRSFYRLKQTDFDGSFSYSEVASILFENSAEANLDITLYPNPVTSGFVQIKKTEASLEIFEATLLNLQGQEIQKLRLNSDLRLTLGELKSGIYLIKFTTSGGTKTKRILVQ